MVFFKYFDNIIDFKLNISQWYVYYSDAGGDCGCSIFFHLVFQFHPLNDFEKEHEKRNTF